MRRDLLLALNAVVLVAACGLVAWGSPTATVACEEANACDGLVFHAVGTLLLEGAPDVYAWSAVEGSWLERFGRLPSLELPFAYPPTALPLFALWGLGDPTWIGVALVAVTTTAYLAATAAWRGPLLAVVAGVGGWTLFNAYLAQHGLLVGTAAALVALGLERGARAPLVLGLVLLAIKPHYALYPLVGLVAAGRWGPVGLTAAAGAALGVASTFAFGPAQWPGWLCAVTAGLGGDHPAPDLGLMSNWFALWPETPALAGPLFALGLVPVAFAWRRLPAPRALGFSLALAALLTPHGHPYDLALWVVPVAVAWARPVRVMLVVGLAAHVAIVLGLRELLPLISLVLAARCLGPQARSSPGVRPV